MPKEETSPPEPSLPIYDLTAFSDKAKLADFYIERLRDHLTNHKFINKPHKHDFYLILFVQKGGGVHTIDFEDYPVKTNSFFLMTPGQVHAWKLQEATDGFIVFFTKAFYQMQMSETNLLSFPFYHSLKASPMISVPQDESIDFVFDQMLKEYSVDKPDTRVLRTYLDLLLLKLSKGSAVPDVKTQATTVKLRKLEQLIEDNFRTLRQPREYADMMNLSPTYLNTICKDNLGKTLTEVIQDRVLLEAKRLFAYSDLNVSQVAQKLNFTDVSYFVRFFKKNSGFTPDAFRDDLNGDYGND